MAASLTPLGALEAPPDPGPIGTGEPVVFHDERRACVECGAHVTAWVGHTVSGTCPVCGSYNLRPLDQPPR